MKIRRIFLKQGKILKKNVRFEIERPEPVGLSINQRSQTEINLKNKLRYLIKSKFVRNVAVVASGTAGAQAIAMAFSPVITRLYGPETFGLLGTFLALVAMISPLSALSYPIAIVLPKEDSDARGIVRLSIYISLALTIIFIFAILIAGDLLMGLISATSVSAFALLIPLNMLFSAWVEIAKQWLIRKKHFQVTAKAAVAQTLTANIAKVGIGWFHPLATVLIILTTIGSAFHAVLLYVGCRSTGRGSNLPSQPQPRTPLFELAKRYYDFPLYRTPQVFINAISQSLPVLMLAAFFGPASAGFYALCSRVLTIPTRLISGSVGNVFYPRITEATHKGENITRLIVKATLALAAIGFFPFAIIVAFGPWLFAFVFGSEWMVAGEYARWLAVMIFFNFINRPVIVSVAVLGLQRGFMIYEVFSTGSKLLALYIGFYLYQNDIIAIALFSIFGAIANFILIVWVIRHSAKKFRIVKPQ